MFNYTSDSEGKRSKRYVNSFDSAFLFICPYGQTISRISSYHNDNYEDRRFSIDCATPRSSIGSCSLSGYVNSFDRPFEYICPSNRVISGMGGYHSNSYEDRRWQYWCCGGSLRVGSCYWTSYVNYFDEYFNFYVPYGSYITGVSSYHDNGYEDRRFRFRICY
ncbi:millepora cytotoxin-1-like [Engraulis encrasicolus]|uniref:millepora cytotoxin-1-like n=1 Tax=Engraulis encrasicolus TaxID=184585 RepID=UPI002FD2E34C